MTARCEKCGQALPEFGGIVADEERGEVRFNGHSLRVTNQEFDLFRFLLQRKGRAADKGTIHDFLYQLRNEDVEIKIVDVLVCKLRKKLKPLGIEIATVWGRGYYLVQPKQPEARAA